MQNCVATGLPLTSAVAALQPGVAWVKVVSGELTQPASDSRHTPNSEHPFGTLKQWMGATHFLSRKLNGVSAEMSLNVLAYTLKRVMKIIGTTGLMKALTA